MNKDQLQKEILEKVKEGVKPSDIKKMKGTENPQSSTTIPTPPPAPPLPKQTPKPNQPKPKIEVKKEPVFYCFGCKTKKPGQSQLIKVAQTDLEYNLVRGRSYSFCSNCQPQIKEFNEYDLLNDNPHL